MLILLIIICVLIGLAYADYCLVDNAAHFGITFNRIAEEEECLTRLKLVVESERAADEEEEAEPADASQEDLDADEDDVVVPPAVDRPGVAARTTGEPGRNRPLRRPGSGRRVSGVFPAHPSVDAGVAPLGS